MEEEGIKRGRKVFLLGEKYHERGGEKTGTAKSDERLARYQKPVKREGGVPIKDMGN